MSRTRRIVSRFVIVAILIAGVLGAFWWVDRSYNKPARDFEKAVHAGMTRNQVLRLAGEPRERLARGVTQWPWGVHPERVIRDEAWVYYFGLGGIHRVTILLNGNVVVGVFLEST